MRSFFLNRNIATVFLILSLAVLPVITTAALAMEIEWDQTFYVKRYSLNYASFAAEAQDGGYLVIGHTKNDYSSPSDIFVVKTDSSGYQEWSQTYGGEKNESAASAMQTPDGGFLIAGNTNSYGAGSSDVWLIKTDANGNIEWDRTYGGSEGESATSMVQTPDGGYLIAGNTGSYGAGGSDAWLLKIDAEGNMEWNQTYGGAGSESAYSAITAQDGGYLFVGVSGRNGWLVKTSQTGEQEWEKIFDYGNTPNTSTYLASVQQTTDGGYILFGSAYDSGQELTSGTDGWLIKTDAEGNTQWDTLFRKGYNEHAQSVHQTNNGGYIVTADASFNIWVARTDSTGNITWSEHYKKDTRSVGAASGMPTSDGGYLVSGWVDTGWRGFWVAKLGSSKNSFFTRSDETFEEIDFLAFDSKMGDVDGDGDLDILFSGAGGSSAARIYLNNGSGNFTDSGQDIGSGTSHDLSLRDFDNDADLDLAICVDGELRIYFNNGSGTFSNNGQSVMTNNNYMLAAGDLDNDGDVDIVAATENHNYVHYYLNNGYGILTDGGYFPIHYAHEPAIADVDGNGTLDVGLAMNWYSTFIYYNQGNAEFGESSQVSGGYKTQGGVYFADLDGDGDLDLFEANYSGDSSNIFWNNGYGSLTESGQVIDGYLDDVTKVDFGDIDNDGDLDLLASSQAIPGEAFYLNDGTGEFVRKDALFSGEHISLGDVDNDGDLDVVSGSSTTLQNALYISNYAETAANTGPTQPTGLEAVRDGESITFSWEAGSDAETPTALLTYNLRVGTIEGGNDIFSGVIPAGPGNVGHTLSWKLSGLADMTYYWSVQTIDSGFQPSQWGLAEVEMEIVNVTVEIKPETLNLGKNGVFTAFITLPDESEYALSDMDSETLNCHGAPVISTNLAAKKLIAKFNAEDLVGVSAGDEVILTVTGSFIDGSAFEGSDTIRVTENTKKKK